TVGVTVPTMLPFESYVTYHQVTGGGGIIAPLQSVNGTHAPDQYMLPLHVIPHPAKSTPAAFCAD
ncbi:MAG TPA: hypothetical protein VLF89_10340, partial [Candidatus Saccharimonadales bacterium]|nr:hypothetical protein [Candidatus Saccharimonadales bacterium]